MLPQPRTSTSMSPDLPLSCTRSTATSSPRLMSSRASRTVLLSGPMVHLLWPTPRPRLCPRPPPPLPLPALPSSPRLRPAQPGPAPPASPSALAFLHPSRARHLLPSHPRIRRLRRLRRRLASTLHSPMEKLTAPTSPRTTVPFTSTTSVLVVGLVSNRPASEAPSLA
jgi:hypothetical protein